MPDNSAHRLELVAVQMVSSPDIEANFSQLEAILNDWQRSKSRVSCGQSTLVVLPESFALFDGPQGWQSAHRERLGALNAPIQSRLSKLAKQYGIWLVGGTIPTYSDECRDGHDKYHASITVFDPQGQLRCDYQKLHLFDVEVNDNTGVYRESDTTLEGQQVALFELQGITVGLAVCYDVRFPALFQTLVGLGAEVIVLPSAFTCPTGQAHWDTLIRARAIENQVYMVAAAQGGTHANHRKTYGHSMIVDPWGEVLAQIKQGTGWVDSLYDQSRLVQVRGNMPLQQHNRFKNELINE